MAGSIHNAGPRMAYMNKLPPHGSTEFPVGTIIVKEPTEGDLLTRDVLRA